MSTLEERRKGVTIHDPECTDSGYILYNSRHMEEAKLIDRSGNVLHRWAYRQGYTWHYAELMSNGLLGVIIKEEEDRVEGMYLELDWNSVLVRRLQVMAHHDFEYLENGNVVVVCREYLRDRRLYDGPEVKSDALLTFTPESELAWSWHAHEHVEEILAQVPLDLPGAHKDWAHTNCVEVLPDNPTAKEDERFRAGNYLFSMARTEVVGVIDGESGEVVWAWGPGTLDSVHMPSMLDNGHLLIYVNGSRRLGYTRIIELDPLIGEIVWAYKADSPQGFYSPSRGSCQRLPNGNTLISDADNGRLFEVTREGDMVWEFMNPDLRRNGSRQAIYRAMRYGPAFIDAVRSE
jgi:hypothetical protein